MRTIITLVLLISLLIVPCKGKAQLGFDFQESAHYTYNYCTWNSPTPPYMNCQYVTITLNKIPMGIPGISDRVITSRYSEIQLYDIDTIGMGSGKTPIYDYVIYFDSAKNQIKAIHDLYFWANYPSIESNFSNYDSLTKVLYDFSQNVGDTVNSDLFKYSISAPLIVNQVDTINFLNQNRKRIHFGTSNAISPYQIIEGIGILGGIYENDPSFFEQGYQYVCVRIDDVLILGQESGCQLSIDEKGATGLNLYPNPAQDLFSLHLSEVYNSESLTYSILDISGKKVLEGTSPVNAEIDVSSLPNGYYFVLVGLEKRKHTAPLIISR
jgi:hypothetical protein